MFEETKLLKTLDDFKSEGRSFVFEFQEKPPFLSLFPFLLFSSFGRVSLQEDEKFLLNYFWADLKFFKN